MVIVKVANVVLLIWSRLRNQELRLRKWESLRGLVESGYAMERGWFFIKEFSPGLFFLRYLNFRILARTAFPENDHSHIITISLFFQPFRIPPFILDG